MAKKTKSTAIDFTAILRDMLEDYGEEVRQDAIEVLGELSTDIVREVKEGSPVGTGTEHYADGWTADRHLGKYGEDKVIIYNATKPTLTHLLENGHRGYPLKNGGRTQDVKGVKHIAPAQKWAENEAVARLERKIKA